MTGVLGGTVVATGLVTALAVAGETAAVWALAAFGMLGASMALSRLREWKQPQPRVWWWTEHDEAILRGDLTTGAWERAGQTGGEPR